MRSLTEKFSELRQLLRTGLGSVRPTGFDPVYYLVFPADEILLVKQCMLGWEAQLEIDGFDVHQLSMTEVLNAYFRAHPLREVWIEASSADPENVVEVNRSLAGHLDQDHVVRAALEEKLAELRRRKSAVLFVTDLEALHPYLRIGAIEQQLAGIFCVPTVVLYPGVAGGAFSRRFLGIHKEDGNYRSQHLA
jgi:hypothetical protein